MEGISLFGRNFNLVGSSNSDFLIKTKGLVKVLYGNKFIDLIKDGKINSDIKFAYSAKDYNDIGNKEGLYVLEDGSIWIKVGNNPPINLVGDSTYVSFLAGLKSNSEAKYNALKNIGFLYSNLEDVNEDSLLNGLIYVEAEKKLYMVINGLLSEFHVDLPNPITELVVIAKNDNKQGSLLILGNGVNNSLAFANMFIYNNDKNYGVIDNTNRLYLQLHGLDKIVLQESMANFLVNIVTDCILSNGASSEYGYRLYFLGGKSTLEVDNLIVRNKDSTLTEFIHPTEWYSNYMNIVEKAHYSSDEDLYVLTLQYEHQYNVGDSIYTFVALKNDEIYHLEKIPLLVTAIKDLTITVKPDTSEDVLNSLIGNTIFLAGRENIYFLRRSSLNLDLIESKDFEEEAKIESIATRVGDISELNLTINDANKKVSYDYNQGIYSDDAIFLRAAYSSDYELDLKDDSSRLASTEWVKDVAGSKDIDLTINSYPFETSNISTYLNNAKILQLVTELEANTTKGYICNHGMITILKSGSTITYSAIVRSVLKDGSYSYRTINAVYNGSYTLLSTYVIEPYFNAGYYWSSGKSGNTPTSPVFIGTTYEGFIPSSSLPYLWYTNDGETWTLINQYVYPESDRVYILSTNLSSYTDSNNKTYLTPAGFICYYKNYGSYECGYGKSNFITVTYTENTDLAKITSMLSTAQSGKIPSKAGYLYLWSINERANKTTIQSWRKESTLLVIEPLLLTIDNADWGNRSTSPGYTVWEVNSSNKITGEPSLSDFSVGNGTPTNWSLQEWRDSFLKEILSYFLLANKSRYNSVTGWNMSYEGCIFCSGFGGYYTARIGGIEPPTSDNSSDIGYKPTCGLTFLTGKVIGYGYSADFEFDNVKLGELCSNLAKGTTTASVGNTLDSSAKRYYKVSYDSYSVNIKSMPSNAVNLS